MIFTSFGSINALKFGFFGRSRHPSKEIPTALHDEHAQKKQLSEKFSHISIVIVATGVFH